jgi:hypothetical protein
VTPAIQKALRIIARMDPDQRYLRRGVTTRRFAMKMWPDSIGWRRTSNCGTNGAMRGRGPTFAATALLKRMEREGLLYSWSTDNYIRFYCLSPKGRELLEKQNETITEKF